VKYDYLLFDADDTLLDFKKSEDVSFQIVLEKNKISGDIKSLHASYKLINEVLWTQHALGLVSKDFLKVERFRKFLEVNELEANPVQMSDDYLDTLPAQVFLVDGALELLHSLHKKIPLIIVTNGIGTVQHKRLHNSGLKPMIDLMVVSEECGYSKPDKRIFHHTFDLLKVSPENHRVLMIGDKLETDILGATNVGIDSCWFNPDQTKNDSGISPTFEISEIQKVLGLL
jgi:2-haloacid dehalogenase